MSDDLSDDDSTWRIREHDGDIDVEQMKYFYEHNPSWFTIRMHHAGCFSKFPGRKYVGGTISYIDKVDGDDFSIVELQCMIEDLGYDQFVVMYYHYRQPDLDLDLGLFALGNDDDVEKMIPYATRTRIIDVYIEHGITTVKTYWRSPQKRQVVIELLDDDDEIDNRPIVRPKPQKLKPKKLLLEWSGNQKQGQSSGGHSNESGYRPQFVQTENESKDPFEGLEPLTNTSFDPFEGFENIGSNPNVEVVVDRPHKPIQSDRSESDSESGESDSSDSDFVEDEYNQVVDVEVDMREFHRHVDHGAEWVGRDEQHEETVLENPEVDGLDFSDYDSGSGNSDDELGRLRKRKLRELKKLAIVSNDAESSQKGKVNWYVGQVFGNPLEVKEHVKQHAVFTRRLLFFDKNDPKRIRVKCQGQTPCYDEQVGGPKMNKETQTKESEGSKVIPPKKKKPKVVVTCPWVLHVSKCKDQHWMVKTFNDTHTCLQERDLKWCSSSFLAKHIGDTVTSNPEIPSLALKHQLERDLGLGITRQKAYRAKQKALHIMKGDEVQQYALLRDYVLELQSTNPGTTVTIDVQPGTDPTLNTRQFRRIYVCLGALKEGFKSGNRDILGLDGCFLKKPRNGQILVAVGVDANNGIYPLAYAVVEAENGFTWTWFLENLANDLGLQQNSNFTFISDRQKGLLQAIGRMFPCAEHRFCIRHIYDNFHTSWKTDDYKKLFWKCACVATVVEFDNAMEEMKSLDTRCYEWLKQIPPQHWARSHFTGRAKCDLLLNNISESFNRRLVEARDQPIITCLEYIMEYLMKRIVIVQQTIEKSVGPLTPNATTIFNGIKRHAENYVVTWNGGNKYQCSRHHVDQYVVDMNEKSCSCRKWDLTGFPCAHGVAAIWNMSMNGLVVGVPEDFVHQAYRLCTWKEVYSHKINPISGRKLWKKSQCPTTLLPPIYHKQAGRPQKKRRKSQMELERQPAQSFVSGGKLSRAGTRKVCSRCKQSGHNARGCGKRTAGGQSQGPTQSQSEGPSQPMNVV